MPSRRGTDRSARLDHHTSRIAGKPSPLLFNSRPASLKRTAVWRSKVNVAGNEPKSWCRLVAVTRLPSSDSAQIFDFARPQADHNDTEIVSDGEIRAIPSEVDAPYWLIHRPMRHALDTCALRSMATLIDRTYSSPHWAIEHARNAMLKEVNAPFSNYRPDKLAFDVEDGDPSAISVSTAQMHRPSKHHSPRDIPDSSRLTFSEAILFLSNGMTDSNENRFASISINIVCPMSGE